MKIRTHLLSTLAALATAASASAGGVLATAPANSGYPDDQTLNCNAVNVGTKPVELLIEVFSIELVASTSSTLAPGESNGVNGGVNNGAWCRFTVLSGSSKSIRAAGFYDNGSEYTIAVPAQ